MKLSEANVSGRLNVNLWQRGQVRRNGPRHGAPLGQQARVVHCPGGVPHAAAGDVFVNEDPHAGSRGEGKTIWIIPFFI
jgi:hypothetical protein